MAGQMKTFLDACGQLWFSNALVGKVGSFFVSSATQHGGNEATILTSIPAFLVFHILVPPRWELMN